MPDIKIRGIRTPLPQGYVIGRLSPGEGDAELIDMASLGLEIVSTGAVPAPGAITPASAGYMLPLVTGDTSPGTGPYPIADPDGQFIGVPV